MKYLGRYEVTLDVKNRFLMPKALREKLGATDNSVFYISRNYHNQKCLFLYTEEEFNKEYEQVCQLEDKEPEVAMYYRLIFGETVEVKLDNSDRIHLDKSLTNLVGITKDVLMISAGNKMELWDADTYRQYLADNMAQLPSLAKKMGGNSMYRKNNYTTHEPEQ